MKKSGKNELWQAAAFLLCMVLPLFDNQDGSEIVGGRVTGPLVSMFDGGLLLFILAFFLTFLSPRVAAAIGLMACLLCFPLYLYFMVPGLFRAVFGGEWSVPLQRFFIWDPLAILGLLTLAAAAFAGGHRLLAGCRKTSMAKNV